MRAEIAERARPGLVGLEAPRVEGGIVAPVLQVAAAEMPDLAQLARVDQLARQAHGGHEAVVEAAEVLDARRLDALPDLVALGGVAAERLLAEDVLARLRGRDRRLGMERVRAAVVEEADRGVGDDVLPVGRPALVAVAAAPPSATASSSRPAIATSRGCSGGGVEYGDLPERARVRLAHEGVAEHPDPDFVRPGLLA